VSGDDGVVLVFILNTGYRCERCDDGYYDKRAASAASNDAAAGYGDEKDEDNARECVRCRCNNNIDSNAVGNCDRSAAVYTSALSITSHLFACLQFSWRP